MPTPTIDTGLSLSPGTDRTLSILEKLSESHRGLSVAELVRELGVSQNSVFRITATLHERGYLYRREDDKRYIISNKLFDLVRPKVNEKSLAVCAYESLRSLSQASGETSQLLIRSGNKGVVLEQVGGKHPVKVLGEVGLSVPLYSCAPGKAILAWLPDGELAEWFSSVQLKKFTTTTRATRKALTQDLETVRANGYAVDLAEGLEGIHCISAPVFNEYDYPVAAVTVMAPIFRLPPEQFPDLGKKCILAASEIRDRLLS